MIAAAGEGGASVEGIAGQDASVRPLLATTFAALDEAGVRWLVLRDSSDPAHDVDLLVAAPDRDRVHAVALANGFLPLQTWGRGSHRFLVGYDASSDTWIRLDTVSELRFGAAQELRIRGAAGMLARRERDGAAWVPAPDDGFWSLLLHVLHDQDGDPGRHRGRLEASATQEGALARTLAARCRGLDVATIAAEVSAGRWSAVAQVRAPIRAGLRQGSSVGRSVSSAVGRKATRLFLLRSRGMTLALLGPDGAGKSSIAAALERRFAFPVVSVYMGMHRSASGSSRGERPLPLPVRIPRQWLRYLRAQANVSRGRLVVFDRYAHDALVAARPGRSAARRAGRRILGSGFPTPGLTVVLDAPAEVLHARKPEASVEILDRRRRAYLALAERKGWPIVDVTDPPDEVRRRVTALVWRAYLDRARR